MKTNKLFLILFMICANITAMAQTFYDSKANLAGVSGNFKELVKGGYNGKFFDNDVNIKDPGLMNDGKKPTYNMPAMTNHLNQIQAGKKVLDYLFMRDGNGKLSEARLKERAIKNIQLNDVERARVGVIDPNTILQEDYMGILQNNYIVFFKRDGNRTIWSVFHVDIDQNTLDDVFAAWDNPARYDAIRVNVSPVASDRTKDDHLGLMTYLIAYYSFNWNALKVKVNAPLRAIGLKVPALAIRGQVYKEGPLTADAGSAHGIKNADRLVVYRQYQDKQGRYRSRKIGAARAAAVTDTTIAVYPYSGLKPSYKKGDIVCYKPDRRYTHTFTYGMSADMYTYCYMFDYLSSVSKSGISSHALAFVSYSYFKNGKNSLFLLDDGKLMKSPNYLSLGIGWGRGFTLFNNLQLMPYGLLGFDSMSFNQDGSTKKGNRGDNSIFIGVLGVQASVKLIGKMNIVGGLSLPFKIYDLNESKGNNGYTYKFIKEYVYDPAGWKRFAPTFSCGVSFSM